MALYDEEEQCVTIKIKYSSINKRIIEKLESMERRKSYPFMFLTKAYVGENGLIAVPITAYYKDGAIVNLTI